MRDSIGMYDQGELDGRVTSEAVSDREGEGIDMADGVGIHQGVGGDFQATSKRGRSRHTGVEDTPQVG